MTLTENDPFRRAVWISRAVPRSERITRENRRARVDWVAEGSEIAQEFDVFGPITAVTVDVAGPGDVDDPYTAQTRFTLRFESLEGSLIAERTVQGPLLLWDWFGQMIELPVSAPAGRYRLVLRAEQGVTGWHTADAAPQGDDGVSPNPVLGQATRDREPVRGTRLLAIETDPAPNPWFRNTITVEGSVQDATLAAVVLGCGVVRINGHRVGNEAVGPAVTDYDKTILYRTWPVGHLLRSGPNEILIEAGRERYAARGGDIWGWNVAPWHREPVALARLDLTYSDGRTQEFLTGPHWETTSGPVEKDLLFGGETWRVGGDEKKWSPVTVVSAPRGDLRQACHPPMTALPPVPPVVVEPLDGGGTVLDFGGVITGRVRCVVTGSSGTVRVVSGEQRDDAGRVICENILVAGEAQVDTLIIDAPVTAYEWEPQFGYRGFRWMQVDITGDLRVEYVRAVPIYTPLQEVGEFEASDPLISWINSAFGRTFRNNLHGIPTDTPIYEKNGWTADAHLATEALLHHFDLRQPFGKWMDDHVDAQREDGAVPQIVPTPGTMRESDPAWSASAVLIPWYLYREYGDIAVLDRYAPMIVRFADQLLARADGGLWPDRSWSDWLPPGYGIPPEGMAPTATMMAVTVLQHTARILEEMNDSRAAGYTGAARSTAAAYHHAYFDETKRYYAVDGVGYRQVLNVLPLAFNAVPAEHVASVRTSLINDLEQRTDGHLDVGAIGVRHLLPVLTAAGRDDLALTVLTQRTRPGWGVWFDNGEATLLESWDRDARSRNHYFLGSVASWIQQRVGGMRLTAPGWTRFDVSPLSDERVTNARIQHHTRRGKAAVSWERGPGGLLLRVEVPVGSVADVIVAGNEQELRPGTHQLLLK
jgi:alpha-L-rhamnosidase